MLFNGWMIIGTIEYKIIWRGKKSVSSIIINVKIKKSKILCD